jgi:hypothetical protein
VLVPLHVAAGCTGSIEPVAPQLRTSVYTWVVSRVYFPSMKGAQFLSRWCYGGA